MPRPGKLTDHQRKQLAILEPALRNATRVADYPTAKRAAKAIQDLLRPTGHETRLMQAKNWLFEAALLAGEVTTATTGLIGVRKKTNPGTRVHLEASALLAICYLRQGDVQSAKPLVEFVVSEDRCISSEARRRQFRHRIIARFNEETSLAALRNRGNDHLDVSEVEEQAGQLVAKNSEDHLFEYLGAAIPLEVRTQILDVNKISLRALPHHELKYLPSPEKSVEDKEVGRTVFRAMKSVLYRSLCDPESDIYQTWTKEGFGAVLNRKFIGGAVIAAMADLQIGIGGLAVSATALVLRLGVDVYCERFKPVEVMIPRDDSS